MVTIEYSKASFKKLMEKTGYPIASIEKAIKNKPIREFKLHLFPMLKTGYGFVDRDEITSQAVTYVSQFLDFKDNELLYLKDARIGEYHPHLLFQDGTEKRIKENPAAKFYITNGR